MKLLITGNKNDVKDLLFAFKYENMIRQVLLYLPDFDISKDELFSSYKYLSTEADLESYFKNESPLFIIAERSPIQKINMYEKLKLLGGFPISFFSTNSLISKENNISNNGVIIQMHCNVSADVTLNEGVQIGNQSLIGHDVKVGSFTSIGVKSSILGYVEIGENCQISHGVTIMPSVKIGNNVTISNNLVIRKDVPDNTIIN